MVSGNTKQMYNKLLMSDKISYLSWGIIQILIRKSSPLSVKEIVTISEENEERIVDGVNALLLDGYIENIGTDGKENIYYLTDKKE